MNKNTIIYIKGQVIGPYGNIYLNDVEPDKYGHRRAAFKCPFCNQPYEGVISEIKSGRQKGCPKCGRKRTEDGRRLDLKGQTFGYLTALYPLKERKHGNVVWHCKCKCGNETDVIATELKKWTYKILWLLCFRNND